MLSLSFNFHLLPLYIGGKKEEKQSYNSGQVSLDLEIEQLSFHSYIGSKKPLQTWLHFYLCHP